MSSPFRNETILEISGHGPPRDQPTLIFFIPGNPGLVSYYDDFLSHLQSLLRSQDPGQQTSAQRASYIIYGASMAGFDIGSDESSPRTIKTIGHDLPLSLDEQVEDVYTRLHLAVRKYNDSDDSIPVVLIGHSIGAYIAMQIVRRCQNIASKSRPRFHVAGSIGLFPTIYELAQSPTGRKVGPLTRIPGFAYLVQCIAKIFFNLMPTSIVAKLVGLITGMPPGPAKVTAEFVKSPHGVIQALHMAKDELAQLTHDRWDDDFWEGRAASTLAQPAADVSEPVAGRGDGVADYGTSHTQLYFYWGADDHWIANTTRDKIIAKRARIQDDPNGAGKPVMEIDKHGIPHAFCLKQTHSQLTAAKCAKWIMALGGNMYAGDEREV